MKTQLIFILFFQIGFIYPGLQSNLAPFLDTTNVNYAIIEQQITSGSVLKSVLANDPENGTMTFSIFGVTYYGNDTTSPTAAFDLSWALTKRPLTRVTQCSLAESYPFPRNLFCMEPGSNAIKTTTKYNTFQKKEFSLFAVTVFVADNGVPVRNLTTDFYFRVKEICNDSTREYTNLMQNCPDARENIIRESIPSEDGFMFIVPNDTKISRITIDFKRMFLYKGIAESINYSFRYSDGVSNQNSVVERRLLVNTTVEPLVNIFLWKPINISANKANVTVQLSISTGKSGQLSGGEKAVTLTLLDNSKNYCQNEECVRLYSAVSATSAKAGGKPECARQDPSVVITKYDLCKVVNKAPVWLNSNNNFPTIPRSLRPGTAIFSVNATDTVPQKLFYSIIGVTYYANESGVPIKARDPSWAVKSDNWTNNSTKCKLAESLPSPRNLFCIEHKENTIKTTGVYNSLNPHFNSLIVIEIAVFDDGSPQLSTQGLFYLRTLPYCPQINQEMSKCKVGLEQLTYRSFLQTDTFLVQNSKYVSLHKLNLDFGSLVRSQVNGLATLVTKITKFKSTKLLLEKRQHLLQNTIKERRLLIDLGTNVIANGSFYVSFEMLPLGSTTGAIKLKSNSELSPFTIYGLSIKPSCFDVECRDFYNSVRATLRNQNQIECLQSDITYLLDARYKSCGIVPSGNVRIRTAQPPGNSPNGTVIAAMRALGNNGVFYSITKVSMWPDDTGADYRSANSSSWVIKTKSDAEKPCFKSESYPFPRNLFCVNATGFVLTTSKFAYRLKAIPQFKVSILASDSEDPKKNTTMTLLLLVNYDKAACAAWSADLMTFYGNCDGSLNAPIIPRNTSLLEYRFTVSSTSLLAQIGLASTLLDNAEVGEKITFRIARTGHKIASLTKTLIIPFTFAIDYSHLNFSFYNRPMLLAKGDAVTVFLQPEFLITGSSNLGNIVIKSIPVKDYCLTRCLANYTRLLKTFAGWRPRFPCRSSDDKFFSAKYGFCSANVPPSLTVSGLQVKISTPLPAGSVIGKLLGTDREGKAMTYGVEWVHSAVLKSNGTVQPQQYTGQSCTEIEKFQAPLNYICIVQSTGEIKTTSKFVHTFGEVLTVKAYVVDSGMPRRLGSTFFNITVYDPCERAKRHYATLSQSCALGPGNILSTRSTGTALEFNSVYFDRIVFLEVDTKQLTFPNETLHTVFSMRQVTSFEPVYSYGDMVNVTLNNTALKTDRSTVLRLPLQLSLTNIKRVEVTATAYIKSISSGATTATTITTTTTLPSAISTASSNTTGARARKRRLALSGETVTSSTKFQQRSILLNGAGVRLYVQSLKDSCGSLHCVQLYRAWDSAAKETKVESCKADQLQLHHLYKICLNPPVFQSHPQNLSLNFSSLISLSCSFRNYTNVTFQWVKDGQLFRPPSLPSSLPVRELSFAEQRITSTVSKAENLRFAGSNPEFQGYYSCRVTDGLNHTVESKPSLIYFNDISSTRMTLKLKRTFTDSLKNAKSDDYAQLSGSVQRALHALFDKSGMHKERRIVIKGFRPGSVIVDTNVYFMNVTKTSRGDLCPQLQNFTSSGVSSGLEISSIEPVSYDCCYASPTGEVNIKGVIYWNTTIANEFDNKRCPYRFPTSSGNITAHGRAWRFCLPNFRTGAEWEMPNTTDCAYKTITTFKLENISRINITDDNAEAVSLELNSLTDSNNDITNRLDVKFTADTIHNLVFSKKQLPKITNNIVNATSNMMDFNKAYVVESQLQYKSSSRVLDSLDTLANDIPVTSNASVRAVSKNIALAVQLISQVKTDVIINAGRSRVSKYNEVNIQRDRAEGSYIMTSAEIVLPKAMLQKSAILKPGVNRRVYSYLYDNDILFLSKASLQALGQKNLTRKVNSRVLSASIGNIKLRNLSYDEEMRGLFTPLSGQTGKTVCVFWDAKFQDGFGAWSPNGCRHDGAENSMDKCRCNHLTNFAILLDVTGKGTPSEAALALSIISYIGCAISLVFLLITFVTFAIFRKLRSKRPPRILMCLCMALMLTLIIFLAGISAKDLKGCQTVALLIHFSVLASFMWMAVEGFNLYLSFVKIVPSSIPYFIVKASLFAWGLPLAIVIITAGSTKLDAYGKKNGDEWLCMVTGTAFYVSYLAPIILIVVGNLVVMVFLIRSLRASSRVSKDRKMTDIAMARIIAACSVLMGSTWIIGLFAVDVLTIPIQVIFCILNSLQGFFIFIFYCLRNKDAHNEWRNVFGCRSKDDGKSSLTGGYQKQKSPVSTASDDSRKGLVAKTGHYELRARDIKSDTMTTSVQDSVADEKSATLKSFAPAFSGTNEDKNLQETDSQCVQMNFDVEPIEITIHLKPPE